MVCFAARWRVMGLGVSGRRAMGNRVISPGL